MKLHKRIICAFSILTLSIFLLLILNVPANDTVAVEDNYIEASQLHGAKVEDEISFIYTQERSVDLGSNADIYVGLTDKYKSQNSYLVYIFENYDEIVAEPVEKSEDIVHFSIPFTDITQVGDYYFDRLVVGDSIYTEQKIAKNENFGSSFHVNVGEDYTNLGLPADVYSLNEDGTYDKEEDIEAAIKHKNNKMLITDEASKFKADKNDILIALDPGHGGYDPGACAYGYRESDITLQIAYACKRRLEEFQGVSVVMSRYDDTYVGLSERVTNLLYPRKPDLFVSLHINAGGGSGAEV